MSIQYIIQERESSFSEGRKRRYYLIAKSTGQINRDNLIEYMVTNTSLTFSEASSALDYLLEAIPYFLKLGKTIHMGKLGRIKATIRSEGSDDIKDATVHKVKEICLHFAPSKTLKRELQSTPLEKLIPVEREERPVRIGRRAKQYLNREIEKKDKEIARKALEKGLPIDTIAELTGLDEATINELNQPD